MGNFRDTPVIKFFQGITKLFIQVDGITVGQSRPNLGQNLSRETNRDNCNYEIKNSRIHKKKNPQDDEEFKDIGRFLLKRLNSKLGIAFIVWKYYIEPKNSITIDIRTDSPFGGNLVLHLDGIISYSLQNNEPKMTSVLLFFQGGKRITQDKKSVLCSNYCIEKDEWNDFSWESDTYDEWECDELPEIKSRIIL